MCLTELVISVGGEQKVVNIMGQKCPLARASREVALEKRMGGN